MSFIRAQFAPDFRSEDVVLLAMDTPGTAAFQAALGDAVRHGFSRLEHDGVVHEFRIEPDAADVDLEDRRVSWRLDSATATDILEYLAAPGDRPGHHYVDIRSPAETLVLSYDEYTPEYFARLPDEVRDAKPLRKGTR